MENSSIIGVKKLGFKWEPPDPFLFCAHHKDCFPPGTSELGVPPSALSGREIGMDFTVRNGFRMYHGSPVPGFPIHPHRGFETITIVEKGFVDHSDSFGCRGRYGNGDVQWMTAGAGMQHAEMFPLINSDKKNDAELFQIWLNLPKAKKFSKPAYKMFWHEDIPVVKEKDEYNRTIKVKLIAGSYKNVNAVSPTPDSWATNPRSDIGIYLVEFEPDAKWVLPAASSGLNRVLYFFSGKEIKLNGETLPEYHGADLKSDADIIMENGNATSRVLILQARPIGEPVVQRGPFVMNTQEEIRQAFFDYERTSFGGWPWDRSDPVHGKDPTRFATFQDGKTVKRV